MIQSQQPPPQISPIDLLPIKRELRISARMLQERGLGFAANWSAELMSQIDLVEPRSSTSVQNNQSTPFSSTAKALFSPSIPSTAAAINLNQTTEILSPTPPSLLLDDIYLYAKTLFDLRDYQRCSLVLSSTSNDNPNIPLPSSYDFLRLYSLYLAGEQRKDQLTHEQSAANTKPENPHLTTIHNDLVSLERINQPLDPFLSYLYALVLKAKGEIVLARTQCLSSLTHFPCNWSAWQLLSHLIPDHQTLSNSSLPVHFMRSFFYVHFFLEVPTDATDAGGLLSLLDFLLSIFPHSTHLHLQLALTHYTYQHYNEAAALFERIHSQAFTFTNIDIYSNILYVQEDKGKLSWLAAECMEKGKYKEECMCVVGNYYSLRGKREKSIEYFRRALRLNPSYLSAWTLMGHEYVELKNTTAAITCYRAAIDINNRDHRAWYGLGQVYELLSLPSHSLYYYTQAATLRSFDGRIWCALGDCYDKCGMSNESVDALTRAVACQDPEGLARKNLAKLYAKRGEASMAATYYGRVLTLLDSLEAGEADVHPLSPLSPSAQSKQESESKIDPSSSSSSSPSPSPLLLPTKLSVSSDALECVQYLATYHKGEGHLTEAELFANRLLDFGGSAKDVGKSLLAEIRALKRLNDQASTAPGKVKAKKISAASPANSRSQINSANQGTSSSDGSRANNAPIISTISTRSRPFFSP